jgi:hypothetical protein
MTRFEMIQANCAEGLKQCELINSFAFETGYYKSHVQLLCQEVEFLQQELESTIQQVKDVMKDLA